MHVRANDYDCRGGDVVEQVPFIDLKSQYNAYRKEIDAAISRVVESAGFVQGPEVASLESELAAYTGVAYCITCASGTDALYIALRALDIGPGDEVITTGFSFFATAAAISLVGATPVFVDIDEETCNIDPARVPVAITPRTRAILAVGLYGQTPDMDALSGIARQHGLVLVEDAAQSFGATSSGRRSGSLATIGCTSFYPAKPLGSYGEGGALFTDDEKLATRMRQVMNQGQRAGYDHAIVGINGRLHALQAAVLRVKLAHFGDELRAREAVAARYDRGLVGIEGVELPVVHEGRTSVYAQYTIRTPEREALRSHLSAHGVPTAVHYPKPIYRQDAYAHYGSEWVSGNERRCPNCENAASTVVSLPFGPFLTEGDQQRVIDAVRSYREVTS